MIIYDSGHWAIGLVFSLKGSVLPKSCAWALPAGICAGVTNWVCRTYLADIGYGNMINISSGYSIVLGFLLVFRAQIAYSRFWDGASYLQTIRSGWLNATSNLFSFCTTEESRQEEVQKFQHQLVRLMSVLYSSVLQVVAGEDTAPEFDVLDYEGLDIHAMTWAQFQKEKLEILMMWVQRLVVEQQRVGIVNIAPPILSRVFQEFSNGMLDVSNAKRIFNMPFPYPYAQMISLLLLSHLGLTVLIAGFSMEGILPAFLYAFLSTLGIWSINYIAIEIEMPFGTDPNDLPLMAMQKGMNDCLALYLHPMMQKPPAMADIQAHHLRVGLKPWRAPDKDHALRVEQVGENGEIQYLLGDAVQHNQPKQTRPVEVPKKIEVGKQETKAITPNAAEDGLETVITNILQKQFSILADRINNHSEALASELRHAALAHSDMKGTYTCPDPTAPESSHPTMPMLRSGTFGTSCNFSSEDRGVLGPDVARFGSRPTPAASVIGFGMQRPLANNAGGYQIV